MTVLSKNSQLNVLVSFVGPALQSVNFIESILRSAKKRRSGRLYFFMDSLHDYWESSKMIMLFSVILIYHIGFHL